MIIIRETKEEDIENIYTHINEKYVKKYYKNTEEIVKAEYIRWYKYMLTSTQYIFFTVEDLKRNYLGSVKFELNDKNAEISIYLEETIREKGYSSILVDAAIEELKYINPLIKSVEAYILEENIRSQNCFKKSGFFYEKRVDHGGIEYLLYTKKIG